MTEQDLHETALPPAPDAEQIDRMEEIVLVRIEDEARRRRVRRGRIWAGAGAAAAVVALAALIGPAVAGGGTSAGSSVDAASLPGVPLSGTELDSAPVRIAPNAGNATGSEKTLRGGGIAASGGAASASGGAAAAGREIVATGAVTLSVEDPATSVPVLTAAVVELGGYVESSTVGARPMPVGAPPSAATLQVRVPSDSLQTLLDRLPGFGAIEATSVSRSDVTDQAVDLRARIDAAQTSVSRLTQLMAQAGSVSDLLSAEQALSQRQAELESLRQQLASLDGQVRMSSVVLTLVPRTSAVTAEPAGFIDGLVAGWNGLVVTLNGVVIGVGFLLPWLVIAAIVALAVWAIRRMRRRRGATPPAPHDG